MDDNVTGRLEPLTGQVPVKKTEHGTLLTLGCHNTQCRVVEFTPHQSGSLRGKCPACYGAGQ